MTPTYWRSLAQLEESPESRAFLEREFPEGASELPEGITRRDMMMLLGASLSLAGLAGCRRPVEEIVPYVTAPEEIVPGIPRYYATTMPFRRSAYGLIVESHEGRPTKIEGNPAHPSTLGASSSRDPGVRARPLRSRPLAIGQAERGAEVLERFRDGLGRSCPRLMPRMAVPALRSSPSPSPLPPWRAWHPSSAPATRGRSGRPTRRSATRTGSRACGPPRGATSTSCSGSIKRRSSSPSTPTRS